MEDIAGQAELSKGTLYHRFVQELLTGGQYISQHGPHRHV